MDAEAVDERLEEEEDLEGEVVCFMMISARSRIGENAAIIAEQRGWLQKQQSACICKGCPCLWDKFAYNALLLGQAEQASA